MTTYRISFQLLKHNPSEDLDELWQGYQLTGTWTVLKAGIDDYHVTVERNLDEDFADIEKLRQKLPGCSPRKATALKLRNELAALGEWQASRLIDRGEYVLLPVDFTRLYMERA